MVAAFGAISPVDMREVFCDRLVVELSGFGKSSG